MTRNHPRNLDVVIDDDVSDSLPNYTHESIQSITIESIDRNKFMDYTSKGEPKAYSIVENTIRHLKMKYRLPLD